MEARGQQKGYPQSAGKGGEMSKQISVCEKIPLQK